MSAVHPTESDTRAGAKACRILWGSRPISHGWFVSSTTTIGDTTPRATRSGKPLQSIPMRGDGRLPEIAYASCCLLDEDAGYITGQIIRVDGGGSLAG
ncbi:SDR family oxidoreductase [Mycolicibacter heraklionensis]|uniref:SDR family oxidoreductase n=1 Tax=Mycolicibacter heraklionensis TaxID=512402 RepID=UPI0037C84DB2